MGEVGIQRGTIVTNDELVVGRIYRMNAGDFAEFARIGSTGLAVFHPPNKPDMQSCFAIDASKVDRAATEAEDECCRASYNPVNED